MTADEAVRTVKSAGRTESGSGQLTGNARPRTRAVRGRWASFLPPAAAIGAVPLAMAVPAAALVTERKVNHLVFGGTPQRPAERHRVC